MAEKGGFKHFMQKEIFEQPRAVRDTLLGRISQETGKVFLDEMDISEQEFRNFRDVKIVACGTSWHAGLAGKFMIERLARIPVEVDYGSEFRYRDPIVDQTQLDHLHQPVRRDRGHAGRAARSQAEGLEDSGHLQRRRLDDHARSQRHDLDARGPGNRRGLHQSVYRPADRAPATGAVSRPGARQARRAAIARL